MFGIVMKNYSNRKDITMFNKYMFIFDFDGTLVPQTKFTDWETNQKNFEKFKLYINPDAFNINWCIVTSRPKCDIVKLRDCLIRNQARNYYDVYTQPYDIPKIHCDEEFEIKAKHIKSIVTYSSLIPVYVDNSKHVRDSVLGMYHKLYPSEHLMCFSMKKLMSSLLGSKQFHD